MGDKNISSKVKKLEGKEYTLERVKREFYDKAKDESNKTSKLYKREYKKVERLEAQVEKAREKVDGPKRRATDKKDKDIEKINEKLEKIAKQLDDLEMKREEILQQLNALKQEEKDIMDKISSFDENGDPKEMMDLRKRLDKVRSQISSLDARLKKVEAKIAMMNKRKTKANEVAIAKTGKVLEKYNKEMTKWGAKAISVSDMVNARRDFIEQEDRDRRKNAQEAYRNRGNVDQEEQSIDEYIEDLNNNYGPASRGTNNPEPDKGENGNNGPKPGDKGQNGNNGPKPGDKGENGNNGSKPGDKGQNGNNGPKPGDKGQNGNNGSKPGDKGQNGNNGSKPGDKGENGNNGPKPGDKGQNGNNGSKPGDKGQNGNNGSKPGDKGENGNNGPKPGDKGENGNNSPEPVNEQNPQQDDKNQGNNGQELDDTKREEIARESENRLLAKEEKSIVKKVLKSTTKIAGTVVGTVAGVVIVAGKFIYNSVGKLIGTIGNKGKEDAVVASDEPKGVKVKPQIVEDKSSFAQKRAEMQTRINAKVSTQKAVTAADEKAKDKNMSKGMMGQEVNM